MPIRSSLEFLPSTSPITMAVTKFGGQPVWRTEPQWPLSRTTGNPMRFICQIALDEAEFPGVSGKMAYVFMTDEEEYVDGTWEPDGGENAVIIQPGITSHPSLPLRNGPALYEMTKVSGNDRLVAIEHEYEVSLSATEDPIYVPEEQRSVWSDEQFEAYASALDGNKIGGTPIFLQGDQFPGEGEWRLLLQLDSTRVPFYVNFGDAGIAYAFINREGTVGKMLWQCA